MFRIKQTKNKYSLDRLAKKYYKKLNPCAPKRKTQKILSVIDSKPLCQLKKNNNWQTSCFRGMVQQSRKPCQSQRDPSFVGNKKWKNKIN